PVQTEPPPRLLITAGLGVDQRAVAAQQFLGAQRAGEHLVGDSLPARRARRVRRPVLAADHHVSYALLELADVARPAIAVAEVGVDPALGLLRQAPGLGVPRHPPGQEAQQSLALAGRGAELLLQGGRDDEIRAE